MRIPVFLGVIVTLFSFSVHAQTVSGTVTDENGQPLWGVSVWSINSHLGTQTDETGAFELSLPDSQQRHVLRLSRIGFEDVIDTLSTKVAVEKTYQMSAALNSMEEFVVEATRAGVSTPVTHQDISREELEQTNLGQDLPILLNQTVSAVTTSDAGAGVGYTGIRIRGSDATRINVTVNGVPINDAESHGVFWVNMPDFASSTNSLQIQRGVGSSTNGAAAFGASVNMETTGFDSVAYAEFNNSYGSFNTQKHNAIFNSGLISKHFNFEGRLSYIGSDGYIDRSNADLRSYYAAGGYYREKLMIKGVVFSGREITKQAWWGTPESRIDGDDQAMLSHALNNGYTEAETENLLTSGRTYNYYTYNNEIDNYGQDHYQLITGWQITPRIYLNVTGHYTRGLGYFEQSKNGEDLADYGIEYPVIGTKTITTSNLIVRRWLDNHFYGGVYSLQYANARLKVTAGGSYNEYLGQHYGEIIWAQYAPNMDIRERYYFSDSRKADLAQYVKAEYRLGALTIYGDVQYRHIDYASQGVDNDQRPIAIDQTYDFFNPKVGVNWKVNRKHMIYFSVAQGSREPVRSDFTDAVPGVVPKPEFLTNAELGWHHQAEKWTIGINSYLMYYVDQLVLTGEVNDVGSPIRTNVPESYRAGIEMVANVDVWEGLYWRPNLTLSQNKITAFSEILYDYTNGFDILTIEHTNTDIAFSPSVVAGSQLGYKTKKGFTVALLSKYVGRQFLDNTSNADRSIDPYFTNDVLLSYQFRSSYWKRLELSLLINNITNTLYESNGYTYSYVFGDLITENFYYPQAGTNWLAGLKVRF